jgi:acyl dehydratase
MGVNRGYDRVRFPAPVPAGAEVRATMEIVSATPREDGATDVVQRFVVEVRGGEKPACVADSLIRVWS